MALIDHLECCHCDLNANLNALVRAAQGETGVAVLGCGDVRPERKQEAERYSRALEAWLSASAAAPEVSDQYQAVSSQSHGATSKHSTFAACPARAVEIPLTRHGLPFTPPGFLQHGPQID